MAEKMTDRDRELLVKCLGMTTSTHDGEALNALRKANGILVRLKLSWEEVLQLSPSSYRVGADEGVRGHRPYWDPGFNQDFADHFKEAARARESAKHRQRAQEARDRAEAKRTETAEEVRRNGINATFELLFKSDRLPPLKRDYFIFLYDRWRTSGDLAMAQEEQLKRAYAVWG